MNEIMKKSLQHQNYLNAKRKAEIEEGFNWKHTPVPFPVYKKCENIKFTAGWVSFCRGLLKQLRP